MEHYKEADGFKLHDEVYILDYHDIRKTYIIDIFDDYYEDESDYICKHVKTEYGTDRLEDVYKDIRDAERRVQSKKDNYDAYVTRGY